MVFFYAAEKDEKSTISFRGKNAVAPLRNRETQAKLRETFSFPASAVFPAETCSFSRPCPFHGVPYCTSPFLAAMFPREPGQLPGVGIDSVSPSELVVNTVGERCRPRIPEI